MENKHRFTNEENRLAEIVLLLQELNTGSSWVEWKENLNLLAELGMTTSEDGKNLIQYFTKRYDSFKKSHKEYFKKEKEEKIEEYVMESTFRKQFYLEKHNAFMKLKRHVNNEKRLEEIIDEYELGFEADYE